MLKENVSFHRVGTFTRPRERIEEGKQKHRLGLGCSIKYDSFQVYLRLGFG
jgi:hypothetical protein